MHLMATPGLYSDLSYGLRRHSPADGTDKSSVAIVRGAAIVGKVLKVAAEWASPLIVRFRTEDHQTAPAANQLPFFFAAHHAFFALLMAALASADILKGPFLGIVTFALAQRAFCAAAILALASADIVLLLPDRLAGFPTLVSRITAFPISPPKASIARLSLSLSEINIARMSGIAILRRPR